MEIKKYFSFTKLKIIAIFLVVFFVLFIFVSIANDYKFNFWDANYDLSQNKQEVEDEVFYSEEIEPVPKEETLSSAPQNSLKIKKDEIIIKNVPFTLQAPLAEWDDPRQQDGCEEASALMAVYWAQNKTLTPQSAREQILKISDFQEKNYGTYIDTFATATAERIIRGYFSYDKVEVFENIKIDQIIEALEAGHLVIVPTDGQKLKNPFYTAPGPERHNLVIKGFDYRMDEFITNDPGTRRGENYRYNKNILFEAIRDYPTGDHKPIKENIKTMIVVKK